MKINEIILNKEKKITFIKIKLNEIFNDNNSVLVIQNIGEDNKVNILKSFEDVLLSDNNIYISDCNFFSNKIECYLYSVVTDDIVPNDIISVQNKIRYNRFKKCFTNSNIKMGIHCNCSSVESEIRNDKNREKLSDLYVVGFKNACRIDIKMLNYTAKKYDINILILLENTFTFNDTEDIKSENINIIECEEFLSYEYK